ncbi:MAG: GntR family transcriptional regulator [Halanaerobiaceae bacterium]
MEFNKISRNGIKPLYKQIKELILENIKEGNLSEGEMLPTERILCEKTGVSRHTIRKGVSELVEEGVLYRVQGKGTFVFEESGLSSYETESNTIGVILPLNSDGGYERKILNGIDEIIRKNDFNLNFSASNDVFDIEKKSIKKFIAEGVAGLIIMPTEEQEDSEMIKKLKRDNIPFVLVDRKVPGFDMDCVMSSNTDGGYKATEHLIKRGHQKIAFVQGREMNLSSLKDRFEGYKKALSDYGIPYNKKMRLVFDSYVEEKMRNKIYQFIKQKSPEAVFALNDDIALKVYKVCRQNDIEIPEQLSLVGFDDIEAGKHIEVPLTTVAQYPCEMGKLAARRLLEKLEKGTAGQPEIYKQIYYPVQLIIRKST